jgi:hypothetical protein
MTGGAAWVAACAVARSRTNAPPAVVGGLARWFAMWRMLDWYLGMAEGGDGITTPPGCWPRAGAATCKRRTPTDSPRPQIAHVDPARLAQELEVQLGDRRQADFGKACASAVPIVTPGLEIASQE